MTRTNTKVVTRTIIATGLLVPWLTGIVVKLYLDARGQPTVDWSDVLDPVSLLLLIPSALYWAAPFIVLALVASRTLNGGSPARQTRLMQGLLAAFGLVAAVFGAWFRGSGFVIPVLALVVCGLMSLPSLALRSRQARFLFIVGGLVGGTIGAIQTFAQAWTAMEAIFFGFFVFPLAYLSKMIAGLLAGYATGKAVDSAYESEAPLQETAQIKPQSATHLIAANAVSAILGMFAGCIALASLSRTPGLGDDIFQFLRGGATALLLVSALVGAFVGLLMQRLVKRVITRAQKKPSFRYLIVILPGLLVGLSPTIFGERVFVTIMANDFFVLMRQGMSRSINSVAFSPDGSRIAADVEWQLYVWDGETGDEMLDIEYSPRNYRPDDVMSFSPDGTRVAVQSGSQAVILDSVTGERMLVLTPRMDQSASVESATGIAFSPDGNRIAVATGDGNAYLYESSNGRLLSVLQSPAPGSRLDSIAFSPDERKIATGGVYWQETIRRGFAAVFDLETGQRLFMTNGHSTPVASVSFSEDNTNLLTASFNEHVRVWDANTGDPIFTWRLDCSFLFGAVYIREDTRFVTACWDGTVHICEPTDGCAVALLRPFSGMQAMNVHPDGMRIVVGDNRNSVQVWDTRSGERVLAVEVPPAPELISRSASVMRP